MKLHELFDVRGLATVITGGASGLGRAYAQALADNGARLTLMDQDAEALAVASRELAALGATVRTEQVDVTDRAALERAFDAACAAYGRLDVAFVNAGIGGGPGFLMGDGTRNPARRFEDLPADQWERVMQVNVNAAFATMQAAVRAMKRTGGGRIIVTSSVDATKTESLVGTPYVASKGAVGQLVRQAALELAGLGITVNAIAPGPFITNISGGRLKEAAARAPFERAIPMHRLGQAADIEGVALFLASPASRYLTGAQIVVDGGFSLGTAD
jgi:NAD(P)-dependent dehydrogenase (short-subunit alcohol dehydrogenase family)